MLARCRSSLAEMPMSCTRSKFHPGVIALAATLMVTLFATLMAVPLKAADYFAGKTIELLVGAPPGGGYDIYARTVARHIGRHIPGNPAIVVKNMPGAGSAKAAQFISTIAPKDGTSLAGVMPGAIMGPLLDERSEGLFDPTKVLYVGTANSGTRVCVTLKGSKITTFDDTLKVPAKFGGSAPNDSTFEYGYLHKRTSGAIYDIVAGYRGTNEMGLAMERGELDGVCGWDWSSFKSQRPDWLRDNKANVLLQVSLEAHPELAQMGVPSVFKYVKDDDRKVVELVISQTVFLRSYILPPDTPAEQVNILRAAFDATMKDKQFLEEAEKLRIDIAPLSGSKVQELVQKLYAAPKDIVERAKKAIR
jgi:tripartite-type tricarboxylate transporter receptor subunit TctC